MEEPQEIELDPTIIDTVDHLLNGESCALHPAPCTLHLDDESCAR